MVENIFVILLIFKASNVIFGVYRACRNLKIVGLKQLQIFCNRLTVDTNRNRNWLTAVYNIVFYTSHQN